MEQRKDIIIDGKKFYAEFGSDNVFIRKPIYEKIVFWNMELTPENVGMGETLKDAILDFKSGRLEKYKIESKRLKKQFEKDLLLLKQSSKDVKP